jgi:hypothetical protein
MWAFSTLGNPRANADSAVLGASGASTANAAQTQATTATAANQDASLASPPAPAPQPSRFSITIHVPPPAHGWIFDGDIDCRYRTASSGSTRELYVNDGELDIGHPIFLKNQLQGNLFAQVIDEKVPDETGGNHNFDDVAVGEAYANYHLPIQTETGSEAYLEVGQFPLPVGLLPNYDTHLHILQTLAPLGIGERIDSGLQVQGRFNGIIDYRFAATTGTGADHVDLNVTRVAAFRLGRFFATPYGVFNVGGSLLSGRLPVTEVDPLTGFPPVIPPSGRITPAYGFVQKSRIVADGTWTNRALTLRGEAMTGSDASTNVGGYFGMGEYRFAPGLAVQAARTYWNYGKGNSTSGDNAAGLEAEYTSNLVIRCLYEEQRDVPASAQSSGPTTPVRHVFTVQTVVRF